MQIIIDLDGTICTEERQFSRSMALPLNNAVESINNLYDNGNIVIIYTSRSWQEYEMTEHWLKINGVRYNQLVMGKPIGDIWIDDRALKFDNWTDVIDKINMMKRGTSNETK